MREIIQGGGGNKKKPPPPPNLTKQDWLAPPQAGIQQVFITLLFLLKNPFRFLRGQFSPAGWREMRARELWRDGGVRGNKDKQQAVMDGGDKGSAHHQSWLNKVLHGNMCSDRDKEILFLCTRARSIGKKPDNEKLTFLSRKDRSFVSTCRNLIVLYICTTPDNCIQEVNSMKVLMLRRLAGYQG